MLALVFAFIYRSSSPAGFLGWGLFGLGGGVYLFIRGFQLLQRRRLILDTPFSKIRSASMGMVEVNGLAVGPFTIVAPITERPCYFYRTQVWEWKQHGKNKQWVQVAGESVHVPFFVDDNSGRVLIDPRGAELDLHCDFKQEFSDSFFSSKDVVPPNVHAFLSLHGVTTSNKIKVEECCIKPKNSLFILATLAENAGLTVTPEALRDDMSSSATRVSFGDFGFSVSAPASGVDFRSRAAMHVPVSPTTAVTPARTRTLALPRIAPRPSDAAAAVKSSDMSQQQKISAALAKAGISNPAVWSVAGLSCAAIKVTIDSSPMSTLSASVKESTGGRAAAEEDFDPQPPTVLMKGTNNKTFMISWRSQQEVARSLGWKCAAMIWGGGVLTLLSVYILINIIELA